MAMGMEKDLQMLWLSLEEDMVDMVGIEVDMEAVVAMEVMAMGMEKDMPMLSQGEDMDMVDMEDMAMVDMDIEEDTTDNYQYLVFKHSVEKHIMKKYSLSSHDDIQVNKWL